MLTTPPTRSPSPSLIGLIGPPDSPLNEVLEPAAEMPHTPPQQIQRPSTPMPVPPRPARRHFRSYQQQPAAQLPAPPPMSWVPAAMPEAPRVSPHASLQDVVDRAPVALPDMQTRPMFRTGDARFTYSYFGNVDAETCVVLTCRIADLRAALAEAPASVLDAILRAGDYLLPMTPDGTPVQPDALGPATPPQ